MIDRIENITKKSFQNYTFSETLKVCNIFFGTNGSGKSSLASWIAENNDLVRKFDTDYVQNNISTVDTLSGVQLIVGAERIGIEEAIENIKQANVNLDKQNSRLDTLISNYRNKVFEFMDSKLSEARTLFKMSRQINQKRNARVDTIAALNAWQNDIIEADFSKITSSDSIELELHELNRRKHSITFDLDRKLDDLLEVKDLLKKVIVRPTFEITTALTAWLREGLCLHDDASVDLEICKFCGNSFDYSSVSRDIQNRLESEYSVSINKLETIKYKFEDIKNNLNAQPDEIKVDSFLALETDLDKIVSFIELKLKQPENVIEEFPDILSDFSEVKNHIQQVVAEIDSEILKQEQLLNEIENVAKSWVATKILEVYSIESVTNCISSLESQKQLNNQLIDENNGWIQEVEPSGDLQPFADLINHEFKIIGLNIQCFVENDKYLLKHCSDDTIIISTKDLSEGERRLLGFLHFYYDLYLEPEKSLKGDVKHIIFDDPITSLDSENRYYLTELINSTIKKLADLEAQIFIFTHSSIDFHNFGYGVNSQTLMKCTVFKDEHGKSQIHKIDGNESKNFSDYYRSNFNELYRFSKVGNRKISSVENFVRFANMGRLVLESHARSNYRLENATATSINTLMQLYNIPANKSEEFQKMLDILNSLSHGLSFYDIDIIPISPTEVRKAIRLLIGIMFKNDKNHVLAMIGSVNNEEISTIQSWFAIE